jgi:RND family efflux transporter MFP subunit
MKRLTMVIIFAVLGAAVLGGYWYSQQPSGAADKAGSKAKGKGAGKRGGGPVVVSTVEAKRQSMPVVIDAVGTVESEHSVAVRPQTNGVLEAVLFKEGDRVKQGQVLFRIDARPMRAALEQSRAAMARDQAQLLQAQAQEARLKPLAEKDYITKQEYDVALTQAKALDATMAANRAAVEQAQVQLSYATITAPISGRTGSLSVRAGNLVSAGTGGTPLVVINSTQPILVNLSVPQRHLDAVRSAWNTPDLKVEISPNPSSPAIAQGALVFIDNAVNPTTGTIALKARVKNEREELWPGQFVAARIVLRMESDAIVLPESAVQPGQEGPFVYIVKDGRARTQNVTVDRQVGELAVISKGLTGSEQIIGEVPPTLTDGSQVTLKSGGEPAKGSGKGKGKGKKSEDPPAKEASSK